MNRDYVHLVKLHNGWRGRGRLSLMVGWRRCKSKDAWLDVAQDFNIIYLWYQFFWEVGGMFNKKQRWVKDCCLIVASRLYAWCVWFNDISIQTWKAKTSAHHTQTFCFFCHSFISLNQHRRIVLSGYFGSSLLSKTSDHALTVQLISCLVRAMIIIILTTSQLLSTRIPEIRDILLPGSQSSHHPQAALSAHTASRKACKMRKGDRGTGTEIYVLLV